MLCYRCGQLRTRRSGQTYVDDNLVRNRVITLVNIETKECQCGVVPTYREFGDLLRLIKERRGLNAFRWDEKEQHWHGLTPPSRPID